MISCIVIDDDDVFLALMKYYVEGHPDLELVGCYGDVNQALEALSSQKVDLVLLDIEMPEVSGIELVKSAKFIPQVIFVTAHTEYAAEAFEYDVTDYIVKPISQERFSKAIAKAVSTSKYQELITENNQLYFKVDGKLVKVSCKDITCVEAFGDYMKVYERGNRHVILGTLNSVQNSLSDTQFIRIHRSRIIRLDAVTTVKGYTACLSDGREVQISRNMKPELTARLGVLSR